MSENKKDNSLLAPAMMGGIVGAGGYDFQARYITCHISEWTKNTEFRSFINEGTGDVDLNFQNKIGTHYKHHIQIKNHHVTPSELKEVVKNFYEIDKKFPGLYSQFTLASLTVGDSIKPLINALKRLRGASSFFEDNPESLAGTEDDIDKIIINLDLQNESSFVKEKLFFDTPLSDYNNDSYALTVFKGRIIDHPLYQDFHKQILDSLYAYLFKELAAKRGESLDNTFLEDLLKNAFSHSIKPATPKKVINVHNWNKQKFELAPDYEFDYSLEFDRDTRKIPKTDFWKNNIEVDFKNLKPSILENTVDRTILFQGQATLSTGIIFGKVFPANSGWVIEYKQPQSEFPWNSNAVPISPNFKFTYEEIDNKGSDLLFVINVTGDARNAVLKANVDLKLNAKGILILGPTTPGSLSISNAGEAVGIATFAKDKLHTTIQAQNTKRTHLFYFGPQAVALFLGQRLTSVGEISIYEYQDPGYVSTLTFKT